MKKQCKSCEYYPNDCGYWDKDYRNKRENKGASFLSATHVHNCLDYSLDPEKLATRAEKQFTTPPCLCLT